MPWHYIDFEGFLDLFVDVNRLGWTLFLALAIYVFCQRHALRRTGRKLLQRFPPEDVQALGENVCKQKRSASWPVVRSLSALLLEKSHLQAHRGVDIDVMVPLKKRRQEQSNGRLHGHESISEVSHHDHHGDELEVEDERDAMVHPTGQRIVFFLVRPVMFFARWTINCHQ